MPECLSTAQTKRQVKGDTLHIFIINRTSSHHRMAFTLMQGRGGHTASRGSALPHLLEAIHAGDIFCCQHKGVLLLTAML